MHCNNCSRVPLNNDDYFYDLRTTLTGKESLVNGEFTDVILCLSCLKLWIQNNEPKSVKIIRRIENPLYGEGQL